ncbi:AfsR/SARP family transcriptional regulator [Saccharothrix sp. 6-C]|uniref:AfsR/SARP family transcriptional regulator n=1 Tax=Saccharothrix sp. 6-C TaxID=2781735 RepID=UPI001F2F6609|nr:BTAD domain-containing putative transcriptional regulator [Saccharothrix sp. 6-C]
MRFGVLGPLSAWTSDARPVRVPEVKVRALLAQLALDAGRVVPADRLIDRLWGDRLPANPAGALQTRASQLRAALDDAEPGARRLVVSRPPGYLLDVAPDAVDAGRFEALLARAATGDARARVELLDEALALWRGPVLADFADEAFTREAAARLEELRLTAWEQRAEARLEFGEPGVLADELGDLVARHPLRERLRAAHLRALFRAGRQGEALMGYRDLRARLVAELGVEPGPGLVALHRAILEQDPSLGGAVEPPTNLPHPLGDLVGRDADVDEVRALLAADRLVTLTGPGGVGKTRLALAVARELAPGFPDGTWLVELAALPASATPDEVAALVAASVGIRDGVATDLAGTLAEAVRAKRMLLLLDNCEHVAPAAGELAARLLRAAPGLRVLATGQRPLDVAGELLRPVPTPAGPSAVELFAARAGRARRAPRWTPPTSTPSRRAPRPAARRHPAGLGARRDQGARVGRARGAGAAGRPVPRADRRAPRRARPAADPAGGARLELGAAVRRRADRAAPAVRARGRLDVERRGGRGRRRRPRRARPAGPPGGPVAGHRHPRRRPATPPAARVGRRVLGRQAARGR